MSVGATVEGLSVEGNLVSLVEGELLTLTGDLLGLSGAGLDVVLSFVGESLLSGSYVGDFVDTSSPTGLLVDGDSSTVGCNDGS